MIVSYGLSQRDLQTAGVSQELLRENSA